MVGIAPALNPPWTIQRVVAWTTKDLAGRGVEGARLDAELLVAHALGLRRIDLYLRFEQPLTDDELTRIRKLIERRRDREPVAYILGCRDFRGHRFAVDRRVLIPRPETEEVVDVALEMLREFPDAVVRALDVCAGSGAIAVSIGLEEPRARVDAVELSDAAAEVARANVDGLGVRDRVRVLSGSLYRPVGDDRYHVVVSNPPYIATAEVDTLMPEVSRHEPRLALDGGEDGLGVLTGVVRGARAHLVSGGALVVEIGSDQGAAARALAEEAGLRGVAVRQDLSRRDRVLVARAP